MKNLLNKVLKVGLVVSDCVGRLEKLLVPNGEDRLAGTQMEVKRDFVVQNTFVKIKVDLMNRLAANYGWNP